MAMTPLNQTDRAWVVEEAKRRAGPNATDAQQKRELYNYAQWQGKTPEDLDQWMGYDAGTSAAWNAQNPIGGGAAASGNLGLGSQTAAPVTPYKLDDATRASVVSQAEDRAKASGLTREQELYKYAQGEGINDAGVDTYMGFGAGTTANWAKTGMPPAGGAPAGGGGPAGDNRWAGDPTKNPDGTTKTSRGYDSTNTTTGSGGGPTWDEPMPGGGYGGSNLGMGNGMGDSGYQRNPYLDAMSRDMGGQMFDQWHRNVAPGLRSGAMATGGYGGSRQGVVEANSLNDLGRNYGQALTSMYGQDYTNYQNRGIQRQGQAQSYDLGLRSNDLGFAGLDANIAQNNFGNQLASANFGLGVQNVLNNNNQTGVKAGTDIQNTQLDYNKYYNDTMRNYGNAGGNRTNTTTGG